MPCRNSSNRKVAIESLGDSRMSTEGLALLCALRRLQVPASLAFKSAGSSSLMKLRQVSELESKVAGGGSQIGRSCKNEFPSTTKAWRGWDRKVSGPPTPSPCPHPHPTSFLFAAVGQVLEAGAWQTSQRSVSLKIVFFLREHLGAG